MPRRSREENEFDDDEQYDGDEPREREKPNNDSSPSNGFGIKVAAVILGLFLATFVGCNLRNVETPAGYVGYVYSEGLVGKTEFVGLQTGPTSSGLSWRVAVVNVSITPYTYDEPFEGDHAVIGKDKLRAEFAAHPQFRIRPDQIRDFVEHYSTLYGKGDHSDAIVKDAYEQFLKERVRTIVRTEVEKYATFLDHEVDITTGDEAAAKKKAEAEKPTEKYKLVADNLGTIGHAIKDEVEKITSNTPFELIAIPVGNFQPPKQVADAVANKIAAEQRMGQMSIDAQARTIEANGIASAMDIINKKLTAAYLQHEAIEAQKAMVGSPNHTTIYIPVGPMGVPLVNNIGALMGGELDKK